MFLTDISLKRPIFTVVIIIALIAIGAVSFIGLPINDLPEVDTPVVTVTVIQPGASPDQIESKVTKKVEDAVGQISGVDHINSTVRDSASVTVVEFVLEKPSDEAVQDIRDKLGAIRGDLPQEIEEPVIAKYDINAQPILSLAVTGSLSDRSISKIVEDTISKKLATVKGVGAVSVSGDQRREIQIQLDKEKMNSFGITPAEVIGSLQADNLDIPSGRVSDANNEITLQTSGSIKKVEDFGGILVGKRGGNEIHIRDIAAVADGIKEMDSMSLYNGNNAVGIDIIKQSGTNTTEVANAIKTEIDSIRKELPKGVGIDVVRDNSTLIHEQVSNVEKTLIEGCIIAVLIIFLFLGNIASTLISAISLPTSIIATFTIMKLMNFTLNIVTLVALSLSIGLLVDDAIVVIENIMRQMHMGKPPFQAAKEATSEIGLAVLATTLTIVAVFVPVAMVNGIIGRYLREFGLTVAFSVLISLFVSFTLVPMLSSKYLKGGKSHGSGILGRFLSWFGRLFDKLSRIYAGFLNSALKHRPVIILAAVFLLVLSIKAVPLLGMTFLPAEDKGEINISADLDAGLTLNKAESIARAMEEAVKENPQVTYTYSLVKPDHVAMYVKVTDKSARKEPIGDIVAGMRSDLKKIPGIDFTISGNSSLASLSPESTRDFVYHITGDDFGRLQQYAQKLKQVVRGLPGASDVSLSYKAGNPEAEFQVDRDKAEDLGISPAAVGSTLRTLYNGVVVGQYETDSDRYDVNVVLDSDQRKDLGSFNGIYVPSSNTSNNQPILVPISQVTKKVFTTSSSTINRYDKQREIQISASVAGISTGDFDNAFMKQVHELGVPSGISLSAGGTNSLMSQAFGGMAIALIMGALFIFLILAAQFESFIDPLSIMFSLPLAVIGAILGLWAGHKELSFVAMIGIILLMGLVTKNAILLVDFTRQRREAGLKRKEAILEAAAIRLRPIIMTTLAMIFSMIPVIAEGGAGASFRSPMAFAVIGGLVSSTPVNAVCNTGHVYLPG